MKIDRIKWNMAGFRELRKSAEVQNDLGRRALAIADACGPNFDPMVSEGRTRARASVITADHDAIRKNAKENTILRNLDRGRG